MKSTGIVFKATGSIEAVERFDKWPCQQDTYRNIWHEERLSEDPNDMLVCSIVRRNIPGDGFPWLFRVKPGQFRRVTVIALAGELDDDVTAAPCS